LGVGEVDDEGSDDDEGSSDDENAAGLAIDAQEERREALDMLTTVTAGRRTHARFGGSAAADLARVRCSDLAAARGEATPSAAAQQMEPAVAHAVEQAKAAGNDFLSGVVPRMVAHTILGG
jgi:hypothetical protein